MHEHLDSALHNSHVEALEQQWRRNYQDSSNDALAYVPDFVFHDDTATMWDGADVPTAAEDAATYMKRYRRSGQFVLSRTNHHIHLKDSKTGVRVPLNACIAKGQKKKKRRSVNMELRGQSSAREKQNWCVPELLENIISK